MSLISSLIVRRKKKNPPILRKQSNFTKGLFLYNILASQEKTLHTALKTERTNRERLNNKNYILIRQEKIKNTKPTAISP
jgi:hypothetical protein